MKFLIKEMLSQKFKISYKTLIALLFSMSIILVSCEKEVKFNLKNEGQKLVVEGAIETGRPPIIRLSKSIGFFDKINLQSLSDAYIHNATVTVSNGQQTVQLIEYKIFMSGVPLYFYSVDSANIQALTFIGIPGKKYDLNIQYNNKTYTSSTFIPNPNPLDSLWATTPLPEEMPEDHPNSRLLFAQYKDPDTIGNKIRYYIKRNQEPFLAPLYSVYDDELVNGKTITMPIYSGFQKMDTINPATFGYFYKGDTVVIKWCAIDNQVYEFWRTLEFSYGASGNPFASPVEISTNIKGGALGVWAGYSATYDTVIID